MAGIHGLQHVECFSGANFAHDDPIRPHAQGIAHQIALGDLAAAFDIGGAGFEPTHMRLLQLQFRRVFDGHHAFAMVDESGKRVQERGLAGAGTARNQDIAPAFNDGLHQLRHLFADAAIFDQFGHVNGRGGEFADRHQRSVHREGRNDRVDTASVGKAGIDHRLRFIDATPDGGHDLVDDAQQMPCVLEMNVRQFQPTAAFDKDHLMRIDQDIVDGLVLEQRLERPEAQQLIQNILDQLKNGASFQAYARQYSVASTAAVGGDLGWVRTEQLPPQLAAVLQQMGPGTISNPIPVPGGLSILAVQDTRKILTADPRDAILSLKQISINFPKGTTREAAEPVLARFADAAHNVGGCGGADKLAADFHGEMVQSDQIKMRDLPPVLQDIMIPMQVGQATQPFGNIDEGVRVLVICGRDDPDATAPSYDQIYNQMNEDRVNSRAQRYLRDLRRDAIIDFR